MRISVVRLVLVLGLIGAWVPAFGQQKIATVKLQKAFATYWKSQQLKQLLEYKNKELELDVASLEKQRQRGLAEFQKARQAMESPALNEDARRAKAKEAGEIRQSVIAIERKIKQKKRDFGRFSQTEQTRIFKELTTLMQNFAKKKGYTIVLDNSRPVVVLYAQEQLDITDAFIAAINKGHEKKLPAGKEPEKGGSVPGRGPEIPPLVPAPAKKD